MRIKMDGHLVEPLDPDVDATSQKKNKNKQTGSEQPSWKRPRSKSDPKDGNEGNLPSIMETSRKGKEKVTKSLHLPNMDTNVDITAKERRTLKIGVKANHLVMDPPLSTPVGQTSGRGNNHIPTGDTTKEVPPTSSKLPSDGIGCQPDDNHALEYLRASWTYESTSSFFGGGSRSCKKRGGEAQGYD
ncbi:hypothetical protein R1flu_027847 [Riccia fluitans]|uniref:Uncharacterized protein n=1 Tax=Riccia fluitans TaxID=41844 RepID=A0ABD1XK05_9MARC